MRTTTMAATVAAATALAGCQTLGLTSSSPAPESASPPAPAELIAPSGTVSKGRGGMAGTTSEALLAAWGEPTLRRSDNGVELWQYRAANCTLLVYLYPGAGSTWTISHAEAVPGGADEAAIETCAKAAGKTPLKPIS